MPTRRLASKYATLFNIRINTDMLALYTFIPLYCPSCGTPTRLDRIDNILEGKYQARQALNCAICGVMFQLAEKTDILRAATASGGDMIEYFVDDEDIKMLITSLKEPYPMGGNL
jgi:transposase-like protein